MLQSEREGESVSCVTESGPEKRRKMLGGGTSRGADSAATTVLKYDQTGEALQPPASQPSAAGRTTRTTEAEQPQQRRRQEEEVTCSVLTPEQIYSQLSMVLSRPSGQGETHSDETKGERERATKAVSSGAGARKLTRNKRGRERKAKKGDQQPKRPKVQETRAEKRPRRRPRHPQIHQQIHPPSRRVSNPELNRSLASVARGPAAAGEASSAPPLAPSTPPLQPRVHVVEISPENTSPSLRSRRRHDVDDGRPPPTRVSKATPPSTDSAPVVKETPSNPVGGDMEGKEPSISIMSVSVRRKFDERSRLENAVVSSAAAVAILSPPVEENKLVDATMATKQCGCHDYQYRLPPDYELLGRLMGEPLLVDFYRSFHSHPLSSHLSIRLLESLGEGLNINDEGSPHRPPRWLELTRKKLHVDPNLGPLPLARILVSNSGIVKFQHLFPLIRTVFVRHMKECDMALLLSELTPHHVLCPGLPEFPGNNYSFLGYLPSNMRVFQTQVGDSCHYYHHECPLLHIPKPSSSSQNNSSDLCTKCSELHYNARVLLRALSSTSAAVARSAKSDTALSRLPSAKDKELSVNGDAKASSLSVTVSDVPCSVPEEHTPIAVSVEMPVAVVTEGTPNLATYYTELSGQRLISTLSTSPLSPLTPFITSHHHNGMNNNS